MNLYVLLNNKNLYVWLLKKKYVYLPNNYCEYSIRFAKYTAYFSIFIN